MRNVPPLHHNYKHYANWWMVYRKIKYASGRKTAMQLNVYYARDMFHTHVPVTGMKPKNTANTRRWRKVALMLGKRRSRWPNIKATLDQFLVFAGKYHRVIPCQIIRFFGLFLHFILEFPQIFTTYCPSIEMHKFKIWGL